MVAEPTSPVTWMLAWVSKVSLSKADLIVFDLPFLVDSHDCTTDDGIIERILGFERYQAAQLGAAAARHVKAALPDVAAAAFPLRGVMRSVLSSFRTIQE